MQMDLVYQKLLFLTHHRVDLWVCLCMFDEDKVERKVKQELFHGRGGQESNHFGHHVEREGAEGGRM